MSLAEILNNNNTHMNKDFICNESWFLAVAEDASQNVALTTTCQLKNIWTNAINVAVSLFLYKY